MGGLKSCRLCPLELPFTLLPHLWPSSLRFLYRCALFTNPVLVEASDGSSVSNFSSSVLGDDGRVVVLRLGSVWDVRRLQLLFARSGIVYSLGKLFSDGPLSLRADHRGGQNYWGPDSRLNLAHSFAASCCCGHGRVCV
ncbi:hypothetical protein DY000_02021196 [Brassica cretica]|uniref:Uncharacterized protein n=1 Tax=Brassica cretica TaxID=69181 RepID=A0ABQ7DZ76_BRACR|nr:hypothetical protein DY000_02021196 [Brassica cretica]